MTSQDSTFFPSHQALTPEHPPSTGIFNRRGLLRQVVEAVERDEWVAIWAPRYSGRTTFLQFVKDHYLGKDDCLPVYTLPSLDLRPGDRASLFESLCLHISGSYAARFRKNQEGLLAVDWTQPSALRRFLSRMLEETGLRRLVLILDESDQLLSTSLVDLLRELRGIQAHRRIESHASLRALSVLVSGAVSFRNLKLLEAADELSPFENWPAFTLPDLSLSEGTDYLRRAFDQLGFTPNADAIEAVLEYGGGDLNRLNQISAAVVKSSIGTRISRESVLNVMDRLIAMYRQDPGASYMVSVVAHDPRCLDVLERLREGKPKVLRKQVAVRQAKVFGISNPELSGGFLLERDGNLFPIYWRFRNRYAQEVLLKHFGATEMMTNSLDLGRRNDAAFHMERLERSLAQTFRDNVHEFDEEGLKRLIDAKWEYSEVLAGIGHRARSSSGGAKAGRLKNGLRHDRVAHAFFLLGFILSDIFGLEDAVLYELSADGKTLVPNDSLPAPPFNSIRGDVIDLHGERSSRIRESRVAVGGVYSVEIEEGDHLKFVIPLKDHWDNVSGVISIRSAHRAGESWATLFVRVPIIERSLQRLWRRIARIEEEHSSLLRESASYAVGQEEPGVEYSIPVFICIQFDTVRHEYLKSNLARHKPMVEACFLDFAPGAIFQKILDEMVERDPLVIVDFSEVNSNVYFELGLAIGINRPGFPVLDLGQRGSLPELVKELFYVPYELRRPLGETFLGNLRKVWGSYLARKHEAEYVHMLAWRMSESAESSAGRRVVVTIGHNFFGDDEQFREAVERLGARRGLEVRHLWDVDGRLALFQRSGGTTLRSVYSIMRNAWIVVARGEDIKVEHRASQLVALGIAKGLEVHVGLPHVLICSRKRSPEGREVRMPSDFFGLDNNLTFDIDSLANLSDDIDRFVLDLG